MALPVGTIMLMTHKKPNKTNTHLIHYVVVFAWLIMMAAVLEEDDNDNRRLPGTVNIRRERVPVKTIFIKQLRAAVGSSSLPDDRRFFLEAIPSHRALHAQQEEVEEGLHTKW